MTDKELAAYQRLIIMTPVRPNQTAEMPKDRHSIGKDPLPYESMYSFTEEPVEFEEMVLNLAETADSIYFRTRALNRYSQDYMDYCIKLQDMVRKLGSCLVTMEVREQQGKDVSKLRDMISMEILVAYTSFNFRKCHFTAIGAGNASLPYLLQAANMEFAWANLLQRLEATKKRIALIREGKIKFEDMPAAAKEKPAAEKEPEQENNEKASPLQTPSAFPVMSECVNGNAVKKTETEKGKTTEAVSDEAKAQTPSVEPASPEGYAEIVSGEEETQDFSKGYPFTEEAAAAREPKKIKRAEGPADVPEKDRLIVELPDEETDLERYVRARYGHKYKYHDPPGWDDPNDEPWDAWDDWDDDDDPGYEDLVDFLRKAGKKQA